MFKSNRSIKLLTFSLIYNNQTQPATRKAHIRQLQEARNLNHNTKSSRNIDKVQSLSQITPLNRSKPVRNCSRNATALFMEDVIKLKRTGNFCLLLGTGLQTQTFLRIKVVKTDNNETYPQKSISLKESSNPKRRRI